MTSSRNSLILSLKPLPGVPDYVTEWLSESIPFIPTNCWPAFHRSATILSSSKSPSGRYQVRYQRNPPQILHTLTLKVLRTNEGSVGACPESITVDSPVRFTDPFTGNAILSPSLFHEGSIKAADAQRPASKHVTFDTPVETQQEPANPRLQGMYNGLASRPSLLYDSETWR